MNVVVTMIKLLAFAFVWLILTGVFLNLFYIVVAFVGITLLGLEFDRFGVPYWLCLAAGHIRSFSYFAAFGNHQDRSPPCRRATF